MAARDIPTKDFMKILCDGFYYIKEREVYWESNAVFIGDGYRDYMVRTHFLESSHIGDRIITDAHYWDWANEEDVFDFRDYGKTWHVSLEFLEKLLLGRSAMLETIKFIQQNANWRELLTQHPYCLTIREDEKFVLLKYDQIKSDFNERICKECRGLIINKHTLQPTALSFYKFFNIQESFADEIDWESATVREKVDGSKILVWWDGSSWRVSTSGALDAYQAPVNGCSLTFGDIFNQALVNNNLTNEKLFGRLDTAYCYTFELVSPETRVVLTYPRADLYLIGVRNVKPFEEVNIEEVDLGIKFPKRFELSSAESCLAVAERLGSSEEGFVVQDKYFRRVKIKSPAYVALHHLRLNGCVTEARVLEVIESGECSEFFGYFPEYLPIKESVENKKRTFFQSTAAVCAAIKSEYLLTSRKEVAQHIMRDFKNISSILFKFLESDSSIDTFLYEHWGKLTLNKKCDYLGI